MSFVEGPFYISSFRDIPRSNGNGTGLGPNLIIPVMNGRALPFSVMPSYLKFFPETDQIGEKNWQGREYPVGRIG